MICLVKNLLLHTRLIKYLGKSLPEAIVGEISILESWFRVICVMIGRQGPGLDSPTSQHYGEEIRGLYHDISPGILSLKFVSPLLDKGPLSLSGVHPYLPLQWVVT